MAQGETWQPDEVGVQQICAVLRDYQLAGVDHRRLFRQLEQFSQIPDFANYLTYILCRAETQPVAVRQSAGLYLKTNVSLGWHNIQPQHQAYVKAQLLPCIGLADRNLRATVGTAVSVIAQHVRLAAWPECLLAIGQFLESGDYNHQEGALDALSKICEDVPSELDSEVPGFPERPINVFLPRLLHFFASEHATLRRLAVASVNQFITIMPGALYVHMETYLQGLFSLANDAAPEVRKLVCSALVQITEVLPDSLVPHLKDVVEYMLQANQDADEEVALEACEFWSTYCEAQMPLDLLRGVLSALVPVLLRNMVYADDDEAVLDVEDQTEDAADTDQDLRPRFHQSKAHGENGAEEEEEGDEVINAWNLRKCSAAGLDMLSTVFGGDLLPVLMPQLQGQLSKPGDEHWKEREVAVLAMGAVAEGCISALLQFLPDLVQLLLPLLSDPRPLVRSITCWTLSRYSKWIVQGMEDPKGVQQFDAVLQGLLSAILDPNKRVQEAACSAFATLEEEAAEELPLRLEPILTQLMFAFGKYQRRNLRILYDAIGTLADCVGPELQEPKYLNILMPPLVNKWKSLGDHDKDLFPLLECFTSIAQALGQAFAPFTEPVFERCCNIARTQLHLRDAGAATPVAYDHEFVVCALDLLSGLAEALGPTLEPLVARGDLVEMLLRCCGDEALDVKQSALALVGDLAKACPNQLQPRLDEFLQICAAQLAPELLTTERMSVANNACWAIGEIAVKIRERVEPIVLPVVGCVVGILSAAERGGEGPGPNKSLVENAAITVGRLAWVCPATVAPHMEVFMQLWCKALRSIRDDVEKEDAFRGLCAIVRISPGKAVPAFGYICQAIASWHDIHSEELRNDIGSVLVGYKQFLSANGTWEQHMSQLDPALVQKLHVKYGV